MAYSRETVIDFILNGKIKASESTIIFDGFEVRGDAGNGLNFYKNGQVDIASQSPAERGGNSFTDSEGYVYNLTLGSVISYDGSNDWFGGDFGVDGLGVYTLSNDGWSIASNRTDSYEVETTEYLINTFDSSSLEVGDAVKTLGFSGKGDGGGAMWIKTGESSTASQSVVDAYELGFNASVTSKEGYLFKLSLNSAQSIPMSLGMFPSDTEDCYGYFLVVRDYCKEVGQDFILSQGSYKTSGTWSLLDWGDNFLIGAGPGETIVEPFDGTFSGDLIVHGSDQDASGKSVGGGVKNLTADAQTVASTAIKSISVNHSVYKELQALDPISGGNAFEMTCLENLIGIDPADSQHCEVSNIFARNFLAGTAVYIDGNSGNLSARGANASLNYLQNIFCQIGGTAEGFVFGFADGNTLNFLRVNRLLGGTGYGLVFRADDADTKRHARQNICYSVQTATSGVLAEAGDGTEPSFLNAIYGFNTGNAGLDNSPTVETGASLQWIDQIQAVSVADNKGLSVGTGSYLLSGSDIRSIRVNDEPTAAHTLFSRSVAHLDFIASADGSGDKWRMGFAESGDFRVSRPRSSGGKFNIDAPLQLSGQSIVNGKLRVTINYKTYDISLTEVV